MKIKYLHIAYFYILISFLFDPIKILWKGPSLILFGDICLITLTLHILIKSKYSQYLIWFLLLLVLSFFGMFTNFRYGFDINNISIILRSRVVFIFILTNFFYFYVFSSLDKVNLLKADLFLERIIQFNIVILLIEGVALNFIGMSDLLNRLFYESGYRISAYYGLFGIAPNGLVFGRQHASIISIIGILRWFPWNSDWLKISLRNAIWLIAAMISWSLTMTSTSIICFISVVAFVYIFGLAKKNKWLILFLIITFPFITITYYEDYIINKVDHIRTKADVAASTKRTVDAFIQPLQVIKENPLETFIGSGNITGNYIQRYSPKYLAKIKAGDFGFLLINIQYGAFLILILCFSYLIYILKILWLRHRNKTKNIEMNIIIRSFVISFVLLLSLVHYTTLFANGMMQLFAATTALSYVMMKRYKKTENTKTLRYIHNRNKLHEDNDNGTRY